MAGIRFSILKSLCSSSIYPSFKPRLLHTSNSYFKLARYAEQKHVKLSCAVVNNNYDNSRLHSALNSINNQLKVHGFAPIGKTQCHKANGVSSYIPTSKKFCSRRLATFASISPFLGHRSYSSFFGSKTHKSTEIDVPAASSGSETDVSNHGIVGSDSFDKIKDAWKSVVDGVSYTGQKAKDELSPQIEQLLDAHPYLRDVIVPVSCYLTGTVLAWVVMPRVLRRFHKYAIQGPVSLLSGGLSIEQVPYEKSFWGALEDPVRYLITFMAFVQIGMMVAPTTIASQYLAQAWRGAVILSFVWFLHRWKTNVFTRAMASQSIAGLDREKMLALDRISSVGLFVIGLMALAEACGVAVQSILTVGGIGGVATAFASRDVLGNVLSGLSMQFSKPFSLGDTIKAGSVEGQVVEMGLTTTTLLSAEKFPVIVPNSMFSSQVIVNKSRAPWRALVIRIPMHIDDLDKVFLKLGEAMMDHCRNKVANCLRKDDSIKGKTAVEARGLVQGKLTVPLYWNQTKITA
ncbi:Mechanosensitive ion channel protein 1 [Citrus sinensis]|nr:Mechanosensitive ion channel protein 1 [Citrus sinensis]